MPEKIFEEAAPSDLTIHAGDHISKRALDQLSVIRQDYLVKGEVDSRDIALLLPGTRTATAERWRVGTVHGHEETGSDTSLRDLSKFPKEPPKGKRGVHRVRP